MRHPRIQISSSAYLGAAAALLLVPLNWFLSAILAALIHEFCHLIALRICKVSVSAINVRWGGAEIVSGAMSAGQELFVAAAGPLGSMFLLLFCHRFPLMALFGGVHGVFNLLPIGSLDGSRILRAILILAKKPH